MQSLAEFLPTFNCTGKGASTSKVNATALDNNDNTVFYNFVGNFAPPEWKRLAGAQGKILSKTSRQLLSLIVYRLRVICDDRDKAELQESYSFFQQELDVCQRRVRQCLLELIEGGFIQQELRTLTFNHIKCHNVLCIKLLKNFINTRQTNYNNAQSIFQPHNNNKNISKSRYSESDLLESDLERNCESDSANNSQNMNAGGIQQPASPDWIGGIVGKARQWCARRKLEEFHPLSEEDGMKLRERAKRDFSLGYINKLLIKLARDYPEHRFHSKKAVLNYMTKALIYELRETVMVNNENFNFGLRNKARGKEEYLERVEYNRDTDKRSRLRHSIAAVFDPDTAYGLLTGCRWLGVTGDRYRMELLQEMPLSQHVREIIFKQVQGIYGSGVQQLEIIPIATAPSQAGQATRAEAEYQGLSGLNPESIWYKARQHLIDRYGRFVDKAWFSKLEVIEEDMANRKITLKPPSAFIGDWIQSNYVHTFQAVFDSLGFTFEIMRGAPAG